MNMQMKYPVFILLAILFFSCKGDPPKIQLDDSLDIAIRQEPKMLNPYLNPTSTAREV